MSATSQTPEAGRFWTEPAGISPAHLLGAGILAILGFMAITVGGIGFPAAMYLDSHGYITRAADHAVIAGLAIWIVPLVIAGVAQLGAAGAIVAGTRRGAGFGAAVALIGAVVAAVGVVAIATGHDPFASVSSLPNHSVTDGLAIVGVTLVAYVAAFAALVGRRPTQV